jgi:hypothetical protein
MRRSFPKKDSVASFALNGAKFVPSVMAMDPISFATSSYPATPLVLDTAVAITLLVRRRVVAQFARLEGQNSIGSIGFDSLPPFPISRVCTENAGNRPSAQRAEGARTRSRRWLNDLDARYCLRVAGNENCYWIRRGFSHSTKLQKTSQWSSEAPMFSTVT